MVRQVLTHEQRDDLAFAAVYRDPDGGRKWACRLCGVVHRNEYGTDNPISVMDRWLCEPCAEAIGSAILCRTLDCDAS